MPAPPTPEFWARRGLISSLLQPLAWVYAQGAAARQHFARPWQAPVPVICVGNLVAGGAGKTPVALSLARRLQARGRPVHILSRGYGGSLAGPVAVDPVRHSAAEVGDEPLLLAAAARCWVARDRVAGAQTAIAAGAKLLLLDDGLQNPRLAKTLSLLVVDGGYGFGNRRVLPAGPLRERLAAGLARSSAVVLMGEDTAGIASLLAGKTVLRARLAAENKARCRGPEAGRVCRHRPAGKILREPCRCRRRSRRTPRLLPTTIATARASSSGSRRKRRRLARCWSPLPRIACGCPRRGGRASPCLR